MADFFSLSDFLVPINKFSLHADEAYHEHQIGHVIQAYEERLPDLEEANIVLLGVAEERGSGREWNGLNGPDLIRSQFYSMYLWRKDLGLADMGNIKRGATMADTYAALKTVTAELIKAGKTVVILGGTHDLTYAQYLAYAANQQIIEVTVVDALIDLQENTLIKSDNFLLPMLTEQPNFIRHYNHVGFQSYYIHPRILETLDKLRFDCFRLGKVRENLEEIEPVFRNADMVSFDITAIKHADAPANTLSPNGFHGEEACMLARYAGMGAHLSSFGIYGYQPWLDHELLTAKQIAQMLWYFVDGKGVKVKEAQITHRTEFLEFHVALTEVETLFLKSKKTGRWWMQLPNRQFIPCSYNDYLAACNNEIPERWLRAQERT